jgi:hypothetical protein
MVRQKGAQNRHGLESRVLSSSPHGYYLFAPSYKDAIPDPGEVEIGEASGRLES